MTVVTPPADIGGYFCWTRYNGQLGRWKYHADGQRIHKDTKQFYERLELITFPLTQAEYDNLTLDELSAKYPLPAHLREPHDK